MEFGHTLFFACHRLTCLDISRIWKSHTVSAESGAVILFSWPDRWMSALCFTGLSGEKWNGNQDKPVYNSLAFVAYPFLKIDCCTVDFSLQNDSHILKPDRIMAPRALNLFVACLFVVLISGCSTRIPNRVPPTTIANLSATSPVTATALPAATDVSFAASQTPRATLPVPAQTATPDLRLTANRWREWPVVPVLSPHALSILQAALKNPNLDAHVFSRVGDCQFTTDTFLAGYVKGIYPVPSGLEATTLYFQESMTRESLTAANGLGISSVLNPLFGAGAGHTECKSNEAPLDCELRLRRPAVVLIAMGTNWKPFSEKSFEKYLRQVVDKILASGALPILATKADNIETDWKLNQAIANVAYDDDLPLVNVWLAVRPLPNHGLQSPKDIYLTGDGWMARNDAWLRTLDLVRSALEQ
jgi:hypothetical protein